MMHYLDKVKHRSMEDLSNTFSLGLFLLISLSFMLFVFTVSKYFTHYIVNFSFIYFSLQSMQLDLSFTLLLYDNLLFKSSSSSLFLMTYFNLIVSLIFSLFTFFSCDIDSNFLCLPLAEHGTSVFNIYAFHDNLKISCTFLTYESHCTPFFILEKNIPTIQVFHFSKSGLCK